MEIFNKDTDFAKIKKEEYWRISGITRKCYDKDQRALFGSQTKRSSIYYEYIPAENMEEGVPFIISSGVSYDGGKEQDAAIANGAMCYHFNELKSVFLNNKFE